MRLMLALATLALLAQPAAAQQAGTGWRIQTQEGLTAALQAWPGGWALVVRCQNGNLDTYLRSPVEVAADSYVMLGTGENGFDLRPPRVSSQMVFARRGLTLARSLMTAEHAVIQNARGEQLIDLALSPQPHGLVADVLQACGRPLRRPGMTAQREDLTADAIRWVDRPSEEDLMRLMPYSAFEPGPGAGEYLTVVTCIVDADGYMRDCELEFESPHDRGFGRAALRAMRRYRIDPEAGAEGVVITVPIRWQVIGP